ncbi:unnamed protein product, partial [marine sediment metagenome]
MREQGCKEAGRELIIEALKMVLPKLYTPIFHRMEDPVKFKKLSIDPKTDLGAYYALPIQVKRWKPVASKPAKYPEEMKVLAFCASPRRGGNTEVLIDEAIRGVRDAGAKVEKFVLQEMKLGFCDGCARCADPDFEGFCSQKDAVADIYPKIVDSDAIIIGFPIYTTRECGQLSVFFDRWRCLRRPGMETGSGKRAMVIGTWGYPYPDTYDYVVENIITLLQASGVITVEALSACGFEGILHGLDDKGEAIVLRFPKELEKAYLAGKSLATG